MASPTVPLLGTPRAGFWHLNLSVLCTLILLTRLAELAAFQLAQPTTGQGSCEAWEARGRSLLSPALSRKRGRPPGNPGAWKGHTGLPRGQEGAGVTGLKPLQAMLGTQQKLPSSPGLRSLHEGLKVLGQRK